MKFYVYDGAIMYRMDWSDDRLQERFDSIDRRFDEVDRRFDEVDNKFEQVDKRFDKVDKRFDKVEGELKDGLKGLRGEMKSELRRLDAKLDSFQRTLALTGGGIVTTLIAGVITLIATQL